MQASVVLSGGMFSGKSTMARLLHERLGYIVISARETLRELVDEPLLARTELQEVGASIEEQTSGRWLGEVAAEVGLSAVAPVVVDSARTRRQVEAVRESLSAVLHVHMAAPLAVIEERFEGHADELVEPGSFKEALAHPIEQEAMRLGDGADLILNSAAASVDHLFEKLVWTLTRR